MKRSILLFIPLVLGLTSCGNNPAIDSSSEDTPSKETIDAFKEILTHQDLSEFYTKTLRATYRQEYNVLDLYTEESEDEDAVDTQVSSYFNYVGAGVFGIYHDLSADEYNSIVDEEGNIDIIDAIKEGEGSYGLYQLVRTTSFERKDTFESEVNNLDMLQSLTLKSTDEDVWLYNTLDVTDEGAFNAEYTQRFNSSINKELLFSSISTESFREIIAKANMFDAPGNIDHLDKLYYSISRDLMEKNDEEISDFILENQISIDEEEDKIKVNFTYGNDDVDEDEIDFIFPGSIKGTLTFDKNTYEFIEFSYEIPYKAEVYDEDTGNLKLINTSFFCDGESYRGLPKDPWTPIDPTIYDDVSEYLKDVNEQVVPPEICF